MTHIYTLINLNGHKLAFKFGELGTRTMNITFIGLVQVFILIFFFENFFPVNMPI